MCNTKEGLCGKSNVARQRPAGYAATDDAAVETVSASVSGADGASTVSAGGVAAAAGCGGAPAALPDARAATAASTDASRDSMPPSLAPRRASMAWSCMKMVSKVFDG